MIKILDKFVPSICVSLAMVFIGAAIYLHAETTLQNTNINQGDSKISLDQNVTRQNIIERFVAYSTNSTTTIERLRLEGQRSGKIKILIVPGHDFEYSGAFLKNIKESDLTLKTAKYLKESLEKSEVFEVFITREDKISKKDNDYTETFQKYFNENRESILKYEDLYKKETEKKESQNQIEPINHIEHNDAPPEMAYRLYAINKWIEDNNIDIVIHIHFNDYPGRKNSWGKYKGFSLYVPDMNLRNGKVSQEFSDFIGEALSEKFNYSNNPVEKEGIIYGDDLIAVGANNTISAISVLIEYGYIYEKQLQNEDVLKSLAEQTHKGIMNYFAEPF